MVAGIGRQVVPAASSRCPHDDAPVTEPVAEPVAEQKSGLGRGPIIGIVAAVVVLVAAAAFFLTRDDGKKENVAADRSDQSDQSDQSDRSDQSDQSDRSSDSAGSSTQTEVPAGFKVLTDNTEGVSIAVPKDFVEIDPSRFLDSSNQSDFSRPEPGTRTVPLVGQRVPAGSVLAATGRSTARRRSSSSRRARSGSTRTTLGSPVGSSPSCRPAGATNITTDTVSLPAGDALRVGVTLDHQRRLVIRAPFTRRSTS